MAGRVPDRSDPAVLLRLIALDSTLARAEPKTLRYRLLHAAGKLIRGGRRRRLKISRTWPWADPYSHRLGPDHRPRRKPLTSRKPGRDHGRTNPGPVEPRPPGPAAGPPSYPDRKISNHSAAQPLSPASLPPA